MKQILKIGDDCFSSVLACTRQGERRRAARPSAPRCCAGRVERSGHAPLAGRRWSRCSTTQRLESVSVFAQEDGRYVFPPLRPGTYRLRARLHRLRGRGAAGRRARQGPAPRRVDFTLVADREHERPAARRAPGSRSSSTSGPTPRSAATSRSRAATATRSAATASGAPRPTSEWRSVAHAHDDLPAAVLPGDARPLILPTCSTRYGPNATYPDAAGPAAAVGRRAERGHLRVRSSATRPAAPAATTSSSAPTASSTPTPGCAGSTRAPASAASYPVRRRRRTRSSARPTATCGSRRPDSDSAHQARRRRRGDSRYYPLPQHRRRPGRVSAHAALRRAGPHLVSR